MESPKPKLMRFGRSCVRCKIYFVANSENAYLCPWCEQIVRGDVKAEVTDQTEPDL